MTTWTPGQWLKVICEVACNFTTTNWSAVAVTLHPNKEHLLDFSSVFIIGDTQQTPAGIEVSPELTAVDSDGGFLLLARCVHPSHFLPKGQVIAQPFHC